MNKLIKTETIQPDGETLALSINNTEDYKDLFIYKKDKELMLQLTKTKFSDGTFGETMLSFNGSEGSLFTLSGFEFDLLKKFINQNLEK